METQIGQLSRQIASLPSSSVWLTGNTVDNPKNETCKVMEMDFGMVTRNEEVEKVKEKKSQGKGWWNKKGWEWKTGWRRGKRSYPW